MDLFNPIIMGLGVALQPENLLFCLVGTVIGMLVGVLPGLGPVATIAILLPLTYSIEPSSAIIMLAGIFYGAQYGGTITSVLLRLPGEASTVVTTFDGYQMARKGRAGAALGISAIGSFIGGTISVFGIVLLAPVLARAAIQFGPPNTPHWPCSASSWLLPWVAGLSLSRCWPLCSGFCLRPWDGTRLREAAGLRLGVLSSPTDWILPQLQWGYSDSVKYCVVWKRETKTRVSVPSLGGRGQRLVTGCCLDSRL